MLTSVKDEIKTKLEKIQGFHSWLVGSLSFRNEQIEQYEASVSEVNTTVESFHYPNDKMVYLSADADETITELEDDKVYIIGGDCGPEPVQEPHAEQGEAAGIQVREVRVAWRRDY